MIGREVVFRFWVPRLNRRGKLIAGLGVLLIGMAAAWAYDTTWIKAGGPVSAMALKNLLDEIQKRLVVVETTRPGLRDPNGKTIQFLDATLVGTTAMTYDGNLTAVVPNAPNGYAAARSLCRAVANTTTVHMCSSEELVRYLASGGSVAATGWIATGLVVSVNGGNVQSDCNGWTVNDQGHLGETVIPGRFGNDLCNVKRAVACCD